jgi:polysaccharide export outer membrane protein
MSISELAIRLAFVLCLAAFTAAAPAAAQDYIVGEGDVLQISVYEHDDMTTTARVSGDGRIIVPLIGEVKVDGLSIAQVSDKIALLLADGYIVDPQVTVFIEEFRSRKATILGQVDKPGLYELREHTTLLELISKAGGLTADAGGRASIQRRDPASGRNTTIPIDLKRLVERGDTSLNMAVMDGDCIFISRKKAFFVTGEVKKPDSYNMEEGTTVIKAITMAGGFNDKAAPTRVKIIRKVDGEEQIFEKVKMDMPVQADDVIVVPESYF